jgi:hypothetical protein
MPARQPQRHHHRLWSFSRARAALPQLVIIADFYQLPPVDADRERPEDWVAMQQDPQQQQVGGVGWRAACKAWSEAVLGAAALAVHVVGPAALLCRLAAVL